VVLNPATDYDTLAERQFDIDNGGGAQASGHPGGAFQTFRNEYDHLSFNSLPSTRKYIQY